MKRKKQLLGRLLPFHWRIPPAPLITVLWGGRGELISRALIRCLPVLTVGKTQLKSGCLLEYFLNQNPQECLCGGGHGSRRGCGLFWVTVTQLRWRGDGWAFQVSHDHVAAFSVCVVCSPVRVVFSEVQA